MKLFKLWLLALTTAEFTILKLNIIIMAQIYLIKKKTIYIDIFCGAEGLNPGPHSC
jgi:hypothetical protein